MIIKIFPLAVIMALMFSCTIKPSRERIPARQLVSQVLKMLRYEHLSMAGEIALEGDLAVADTLFQETVELDPDCVKQWAETASGACKEKIEAFLSAAGKLGDPGRADDPASVIIDVLKHAPETSSRDLDLIGGYAAVYQLCLEIERDGTLMQDLIPFLVALGCPLTFRDMGLENADSTRLKELAASASDKTRKMPYATGVFENHITLVKLDSWCSMYSGQITADTLAAELLEDEDMQEIISSLKKIKPMKLGFLGDSQMDAINWSNQGPFPDIVGSVFAIINPSVTVVNAGKGGDHSGMALARMDKELVTKKPDLSFVMLGGNDCRYWGGPEPMVTPEKYFANISEIIIRLKKEGSEVVILNYPQYADLGGPDLEVFLELREKMKALQKEFDTGWIDVAGILDNLPPEQVYVMDNVHINSPTHVRLALEILKYLSERY